jgi:hypothetical protein
MAITIPYMSNPGAITKIFQKIKEAGTPETFSSDFLASKLGFKRGNNRTFIPWAKKTKMLTGEGSPTELYKKFRNPPFSKKALADALRQGYTELYSRNEYCHALSRKDFKGLVMEATGLSHDSKVVEYIVSTFFNAKESADFEAEEVKDEKAEIVTEKKNSNKEQDQNVKTKKDIGIGLNYTINLVLPKTDDPAVFNAIFKTLKENLLN